jgi:hypothetical protein
MEMSRAERTGKTRHFRGGDISNRAVRVEMSRNLKPSKRLRTKLPGSGATGVEMFPPRRRMQRLSAIAQSPVDVTTMGPNARQVVGAVPRRISSLARV